MVDLKKIDKFGNYPTGPVAPLSTNQHIPPPAPIAITPYQPVNPHTQGTLTPEAQQGYNDDSKNVVGTATAPSIVNQQTLIDNARRTSPLLNLMDKVDPNSGWLPPTPTPGKVDPSTLSDNDRKIYEEESNAEATANGDPLPFPNSGLPPVATTETRPKGSGAGVGGGGVGTGIPTNPYSSLLNSFQKERDFYFGTPGKQGDSHNLSPEEQARLDRIDQAANNGSISKEQADKMRQAVQQDSIKRTTVDKTPGYFEQKKTNIDKLGNLESDLARNEELTTKVYNNIATEDEKQEQALINGNLALLNQKSKEINDFANNPPTYKEDAKRYWNNLGSGNQVGFGISAILAGFGAGWNGRSSNAFDQLNKNIDRDIDSQRKTYEAASDKYRLQLLAKNQDYARAMQMTGKQEDAFRLLKLQHLNQYTRNMDILSKTTNSDRVKIGAENAKLAFDKEKEDLRHGIEVSQWNLLHPKTGGSSKAKGDEGAGAEFERRQKLGIPELTTQISEMDDLISHSDNSGAIPGVTSLQYSGPLASDEARLYSQQYGRVRSAYIKSIAGASATPGEIELVAKGVPEVPRNANELKVWRDTIARKRDALETEVAGGTTAAGAATGNVRRKEAAKQKTETKTTFKDRN